MIDAAPFVSAPDVVRMLAGIACRNTVYHWLRTGRIRSAQPAGRGGRRLIPRAEVQRLLNGGAATQASHLMACHTEGEA